MSNARILRESTVADPVPPAGRTAPRSPRTEPLPHGPHSLVEPEPQVEPVPPFEPDPDLVKLFHAVDAMRAENAPYLLQFVASTPGEGTTTLAGGFAAVASLQYRAPVLLLDCGVGTGPSLVDALATNGTIEAAIERVPGFPHLHRALLRSAANRRPGLDGVDLCSVTVLLRERFSVVVLDCPAATVASESLALSRLCDGTVLVVRADHARRQTVRWTRESIDRFGGTVLGAVVNARRMYLPRWLYHRT